MKRILTLTGFLALSLSMQACVIAPGMTMTEPAEVDDENVIQVQPITLDLLKAMEVDLQGGFYVYYKKKGALATDKEILKQAVTTSLRSAGAELEQPLGELRPSKKVRPKVQLPYLNLILAVIGKSQIFKIMAF